MSPTSVSVYLCRALAIRGDLSLQSGFKTDAPNRASEASGERHGCTLGQRIADIIPARGGVQLGADISALPARRPGARSPHDAVLAIRRAPENRRLTVRTASRSAAHFGPRTGPSPMTENLSCCCL
jgi:hypothetical protein